MTIGATIQTLVQRFAKPRQAAVKPTKQGGINRRVHDRKPLTIGIGVAVQGSAPLQARSFDVSEGGIGFVAQSSLLAGTACRLTFTISPKNGSPREIEARASIAYCYLSPELGGYKIGAQFKDLAGSADASLQAFLRG
jgi:hypothetical protein